MTRLDTKLVTWFCMAGAVFMMAFQVSGKAARDGLFLTNYRPSQLPPLIVASALTAILLGVINGRLLSRFSPKIYVPTLLFLSGGLQTVEWFAYSALPGITAIAVYIHVVALGALITSGFWSVANEQFDPYTAKQSFARIAGAGTVGGVAGGFLAERLAALAPPQSVLLAMAVMQFLTGALLIALPGSRPPSRRESFSARELLQRSAYLRDLSILVLLGTFSAALLDYVLKSDARHTIGPGEDLMRFFAMFYTGTALLSFLLQTSVTSRLLNRFGLGAAVSTLPAGVATSGMIAAINGTFPFVIGARGIEAVIRGSFFRAGYELLYTPMLPAEKRVIKSVNDVTIDRLGDALGGGYAQAVIFLGPISGSILLASASIASCAGWYLSRRLHDGYLSSLERSLEQYSADEDLQPLPDLAGSTISTESVRLTRADWAKLTRPVVDRDIALRSGNADQILAALFDKTPLTRGQIPLVIPLLANRLLRHPARSALRAVAKSNVGQLADHLLDKGVPVEVRRRLPEVIASADDERALQALLLGLEDSDSRIRFETARALQSVKHNEAFEVDRERVYRALRQQLRHVRNWSDLEQVFLLLSVILPSEPVQSAWEAVNSDSDQLRGLALEYLETALPDDISDRLLDVLDASRTPTHLRRSGEAITREFTTARERTAITPRI